MKTFALLSASLVATLVVLLPATPAQALNDKSFVSSTGSGTACTFAAPCNNFNDAHNATFAGGEITCLDSGGFGGAIITKTITIDCAGTAATTGSFIVDGAGIVVRIRNVTIAGRFGSSSGIDFRNGAALFVENCVIQNFNQIPPFYVGILFRPSAPGAQLVVSDTVLSNNGVGTIGGDIGGGIVINPQSGGTAQAALNRVTVGKNAFGIAADGTGSTGGINLTISDSVVASNSQDGIIAVTPGGGAPIGMMVDRTRSVNNNIGIRSLGPNVTVRVDSSTVTGNSTGLAFGSGGALLSFGTNKVQANAVNGAFSGPVGLQ
jgi:hypothetical protein